MFSLAILQIISKEPENWKSDNDGGHKNLAMEKVRIIVGNAFLIGLAPSVKNLCAKIRVEIVDEHKIAGTSEIGTRKRAGKGKYLRGIQNRFLQEGGKEGIEMTTTIKQYTPRQVKRNFIPQA